MSYAMPAIPMDNYPGAKTLDLYVNGMKSRSIDWSSEPKIIDLFVVNMISTSERKRDSQTPDISNSIPPTTSTTANKIEIFIFSFAFLLLLKLIRRG